MFDSRMEKGGQRILRRDDDFPLVPLVPKLELRNEGVQRRWELREMARGLGVTVFDQPDGLQRASRVIPEVGKCSGKSPGAFYGVRKGSGKSPAAFPEVGKWCGKSPGALPGGGKGSGKSLGASPEVGKRSGKSPGAWPGVGKGSGKSSGAFITGGKRSGRKAAKFPLDSGGQRASSRHGVACGFPINHQP